MDRAQFAKLARSLHAGNSRRGILAGMTGGLLAALPLMGGVSRTDAKQHHKRRHKKKQRRQQPVTAQPAQQPVTHLDAVCDVQPQVTFAFADGNGRLAQTFSALTSGQLVRADLHIGNSADSFGDFVVRLSPLNGAGVPTNEVLAEATAARASVPEGFSTVSFQFANPAAVVTGTKYALVLTRPGGKSTSWLGHNGNPCAGQLFFSGTQTAEFLPGSPDVDFIFKTFVAS